jgi:hypothetical protein
MNFIVAFLAAFAYAQEQPGPITSCGSGSFDLTSATFEPYPIVVGKPVLVTAVGSLNTTVVEGATTEITLRLGAVPVFKETNDFCTQSAAAGKPCPLQPGAQDVVVVQNVPAAAPAGRFNVQVKVLNPDKTLVGCFQGPVRLVKE